VYDQLTIFANVHISSSQSGRKAMATMNVSLSDEFVGFVNGEVESGDYASASEVVRDALRLLRREKAAREEKLEILKREVALGLEDARAGRISTRSVMDILAEQEQADKKGG
jgi:antitoxin ParD1/3/4